MLAIVALLIGKFMGLSWMDPVMGIVGSLVILKWAYDLCRETGSELLDVHSKQMPPEKLRRELEQDGVKVLDIHTWRIAPNAVACELVISSPILRGGDRYRDEIMKHFRFQHLIIEERAEK